MHTDTYRIGTQRYWWSTCVGEVFIGSGNSVYRNSSVLLRYLQVLINIQEVLTGMSAHRYKVVLQVSCI